VPLELVDAADLDPDTIGTRVGNFIVEGSGGLGDLWRSNAPLGTIGSGNDIKWWEMRSVLDGLFI